MNLDLNKKITSTSNISIDDDVIFLPEGKIFSTRFSDTIRQGMVCNGYPVVKCATTFPSNFETFIDSKNNTTMNTSLDFIEPTIASKKLLAKIKSLSEDKVIVEIRLAKGKTTRELKYLYVEMLKNLNLFYQGAEFFIISTANIDNFNIQIKPYEVEYNQKIENLYNQLTGKFE